MTYPRMYERYTYKSFYPTISIEECFRIPKQILTSSKNSWSLLNDSSFGSSSCMLESFSTDDDSGLLSGNVGKLHSS